METTVEFWTPQELTEAEINKICDWLMAWQKAAVTAQSVMDEPLEVTLPASHGLDASMLCAMHHVESLIRHLHALKLKAQPKCELCGEPMPIGEEMFKFHGYTGPCPTKEKK